MAEWNEVSFETVVETETSKRNQKAISYPQSIESCRSDSSSEINYT